MTSWIDTGGNPGNGWPAGEVTSVELQSNVDQPLKDLAARVADTGWQTLTVTAANFSVADHACQYRRIGSLVFLRGTVNRSVDTTAGTAFNGTGIFNALPSDCIPGIYTIHRIWCNAVGASPELQIDTSGTIQIRNMGSANLPANTKIGINCHYPVG